STLKEGGILSRQSCPELRGKGGQPIAPELPGGAQRGRSAQRRQSRCEVRRGRRPFAGGRGGKERAARYERSSDWPRGAQRPDPEHLPNNEPYGSPDPAQRYLSATPDAIIGEV